VNLSWMTFKKSG